MLRDAVASFAHHASGNFGDDDSSLAWLIADLSEVAGRWLPFFQEVSMAKPTFIQLHADGAIALDPNGLWVTTKYASIPFSISGGLVAGYGHRPALADEIPGRRMGLEPGCTLASISSNDRNKTLTDHDVRDSRAFIAETLFLRAKCF